MKIAVIDHSFHKKTQSIGFFIEFLKGLGEPTVFYDESWQGGEPVGVEDINKFAPDLIVIWQIRYRLDKIRQFSTQNIVFVPMYDSDYYTHKAVWYAYREYKFVSFSHALHKKLLGVGIDSFYLQYFPDCGSAIETEKRKQAFFWYRHKAVSIEKIQALMGNSSTRLEGHLHYAPDPGGQYDDLSFVDRKVFPIISTWFENRAQYLDALKNCQLYFAPRELEGIGMSFLEAMAFGCCVVAPDRPTMNEYIVHGKTGLLYAATTECLAPLDYVQIGKNARAFVQEGRLRYLDSLDHLKVWLVQKKAMSSVPLMSLPAILLGKLKMLVKKLVFNKEFPY